MSWKFRPLKLLVFVASLVPAVVLAWRWYYHELGINWIQAAQHFTGDWILRFLILTLLITPLRRIPGLNGLIAYRRMFGLFAFFYACIHLDIYLQFDKGWDWLDIRGDFLQRRFYFAGFIAFLAMVPLAITSTKGWIRRLGGPRWQALHRLVYLSALAGVVHYYWQGKSFVMRAAVYVGIVVVLLLYRAVMAVWKARTRKPSVRGASRGKVRPATLLDKRPGTVDA